MSNPYNWPFPTRNDAMFMSTIQSSPPLRYIQQSSFQRNDIPGAQNKPQIPQFVGHSNYSNSTYIDPVPRGHIMKQKMVASNLRTDDIDGARPQCHDFKTSRVTNPLMPRYQLPYVHPIDFQPPRKFLRDTLQIADIKTKDVRVIPRYTKGDIQGSSPTKLFKTLDGINRLDVKDINRDGVFESARRSKPSNPLEPVYAWDARDSFHQQYAKMRDKPHMVAATSRIKDLSLNTNDIEGAKANSSNEQRFFFSKRREYKDSLNTKDIAKSGVSSLKRGISTTRHVNPLMPQYSIPLH